MGPGEAEPARRNTGGREPWQHRPRPGGASGAWTGLDQSQAHGGKPVQLSTPFPAQLEQDAGLWSHTLPCRRGPGAAPRGPSSPGPPRPHSSLPQALFRGVPNPATWHASELGHLSLRRKPNTLRPQAPQIMAQTAAKEGETETLPRTSQDSSQGPGGRPCRGSLSCLQRPGSTGCSSF